MRGWAIWKPPRRGASHWPPTLWTVVIDSTPSSVSTRSDTAVRRTLSASLAARDRRSPAGVRVTSRGRRVNSGWSRRCSRAFTCQLTAAWLTPSSSAARVKLFRRAAASRIRMALSGRLARMFGISRAYEYPRKPRLSRGPRNAKTSVIATLKGRRGWTARSTSIRKTCSARAGPDPAARRRVGAWLARVGREQAAEAARTASRRPLAPR